MCHAIRRAGISNLYGLAGDVNATGDDVKKLDVLANDIWIHSLENSGVCCILVSEENEEPIILDPAKTKTGRTMVHWGTREFFRAVLNGRK